MNCKFRVNGFESLECDGEHVSIETFQDIEIDKLLSEIGLVGGQSPGNFSFVQSTIV